MKGKTKLLILYIFTFIAGITVLLKYDELFIKDNSRSSYEALAYVSKIKKSAKYRPDSQLKWLPVKHNDFFVHGDKVFTGKGSEMELKSNLNKLSLGQNTLVKITKDMFSLSQGKITAFVNEQLNLFINGKKVKIIPEKNSVVLVEKIKGEGDIFTVKQGRIKLEFQNKSLNLAQGEKSKIDKFSNQLLRTGLKDIILTSNIYQDSTICSEDDIKLSWKDNSNANRYHVKFYTDSSLSSKIFEQKIQTNTFYYNPSVFLEKVYMIIDGVKDNKVLSRFGPKRMIFISSTKMPKKLLYKKHYMSPSPLEFLDEEFLNNIIKENYINLSIKHTSSQVILKVNNTNINTDQLKIGENKISLCLFHLACSKKNICRKEKFFVDGANQISLSMPKDKEIIHSKSKRDKIKFIWQIPQSLKLSSGQIIIHKDEGATTTIPIKEFSSGENIKKLQLPFGQYRWSIQAIVNGEPIESTSQTFAITPIGPLIPLSTKLIDLNDTNMNIVFNWEGSTQLGDLLEIEVKSFNSIESFPFKVKKVSQNKKQMNIPLLSKFKWKINRINKNKAYYGSKWNHVELPGCHKDLELNLNKVILKNNKAFLSWQDLKNMKRYEVKIFIFNQTQKEESFSFKTKDNQLTWKLPKKKKYYWTVTPMDFFNKKCKTSDVGTITP